MCSCKTEGNRNINVSYSQSLAACRESQAEVPARTSHFPCFSADPCFLYALPNASMSEVQFNSIG
jgi:hypothetical protein